ncbi:MAG: hypothetical protein A3F12_03710 [Gammaproteobacteria bacterium RIFCSPHIGHO2_12_FULL_38_14]|nr:MAG: hypothetical protein A3F12_03710 [Gammaproteobacteria bacterium RIFCSPHIGHO2_12_FULL_38_14]
MTHTLNREKVDRPWGSYESIGMGPGFQVKHIVVKPGASLSLQLHHHRSEHWVVVKGKAQIIVGHNTINLSVNESVYIAKETKHRLSNPEAVDLEIIEVQIGDYLEEDDIERFEDLYGRV